MMFQIQLASVLRNAGDFGQRYSKAAITAAAVGVLSSTIPVVASGGAVVSASATTNGYTLTTLATATAAYNVGGGIVPNVPFNVLETDTAVVSNSYFYLPIFYSDNSPPVDAGFPASIANQQADAAFLDSNVLSNYGVSAFFVRVDGVDTVLTDSYIVGVNTPALPDGGGTEYIVDAAVLTPLSAGTHTVGYGGVINGTDTQFGFYNVTVPEPTSLGLIAVGATTLLGRRRRV